MVGHYPLLHGFHMLLNMLKNLLEKGTWFCLYTNALPLTSRVISEKPQGQGLFHLFGYKDNTYPTQRCKKP